MNKTFNLRTKLLLATMALSLTACGATAPKPSDSLGTKDTTAAVDNSPKPSESGCPQEGHIKSPSSFDSATVTFDNQTTGDYKIYWLDFNGKRKLYTTLKAHTKYDQATWIGHVWVVAALSEKCIKLESANAVKQTLVID